MPVSQTFAASRNATWAPTLNYHYSGGPLPLTGGHIAFQLRQYPGAADPANLTLNPVAYVDAAAPSDADPLARVLTLSPSIAPGSADGSTANSLNALPGLHQPEAGDVQTFFFDIRITYADGISEILSSGSFIVQPGVTTV